MTEFITNNYELIKALHIIAVISWMAGMLYLPRLFVYHATAKKGGELSETLKIMERKLLRLIINPAMIAAWIFGLLMFKLHMHEGWMHAKFSLLILMQLVHAFLANCRRKFDQDKNTRSAKFYRWLNEAPTVLMILIVLLVIVKPF